MSSKPHPKAERRADSGTFSWVIEAVLVFAVAVGLFLTGYQILVDG
jgi:hypothetical protein